MLNLQEKTLPAEEHNQYMIDNFPHYLTLTLKHNDPEVLERVKLNIAWANEIVDKIMNAPLDW